MTNKNQQSRNGIPVLGRLPLVGPLFRDTVSSTTREELLVLMRPEVSLTKTDIQRLRQKNSDRSHFGPELDQDDCPNCPPRAGLDSKDLPAPDLPELSYPK